MAKKFEEPFEDTQEMYNRAIDNAGLTQFINVTILVDNKAKNIFKVKKADDILKHRTDDDVLVIINEKILEQLTKEQQEIVVEESLASVSFNTETGKVVITQPDFLAHSGVIRKHGFETLEVLRESVKTLYSAEKQAEDEQKAQTEKGKKKFKTY